MSLLHVPSNRMLYKRTTNTWKTKYSRDIQFFLSWTYFHLKSLQQFWQREHLNNNTFFFYLFDISPSSLSLSSDSASGWRDYRACCELSSDGQTLPTYFSHTQDNWPFPCNTRGCRTPHSQPYRSMGQTRFKFESWKVTKHTENAS